MHSEGRHVWQGRRVLQGGRCGRETATAADGTRPTRIHSCYRPKRSFGQGNIFTRVCDSVHRGGAPDFALIFRGEGMLQILL